MFRGIHVEKCDSGSDKEVGQFKMDDKLNGDESPERLRKPQMTAAETEGPTTERRLLRENDEEMGNQNVKPVMTEMEEEFLGNDGNPCVTEMDEILEKDGN